MGYPFSPVSFAAVSVAGELSDPLIPKRGSTQGREFLLEGDWDGVPAGQEWAGEAPAGL